jgi:hypothetical protein
VIVGEPSQKLDPWRLEVRFFSKGKLLDIQVFEAAAVQVLPRDILKLSAATPAVSARRLFHIESSFDLHLRFSQPRSFETDEMQITVHVTDDKQRVHELPPVKVPVEGYAQKTRLIFPWTGPGMMSQGWFNNGGHGGQSSWFAGDFLGLTPDTWGPQLRNEDKNDAYAGFNRDVIAPAAGVIVAMRNDVPLNTKVNEEPPNEFFNPARPHRGAPRQLSGDRPWKWGIQRDLPSQYRLRFGQGGRSGRSRATDRQGGQYRVLQQSASAFRTS